MTTASSQGPSHEVTRVAPRRATTLTLTAGALLGAICFAIAVLGDLAGLGATSDSAGSAPGASLPAPDAFLAALLDLHPGAWAVLGCAVVVATPAMGLLTTAFEFESIADRRGALMALAVLAVLATSLLIALLA